MPEQINPREVITLKVTEQGTGKLEASALNCITLTVVHTAD